MHRAANSFCRSAHKSAHPVATPAQINANQVSSALQIFNFSEYFDGNYQKLTRRVWRKQIPEFGIANLHVLVARQVFGQLDQLRLLGGRYALAHLFHHRVLLLHVGDGGHQFGHSHQRHIAQAEHPDGGAPIAKRVGQLIVLALLDLARDDVVAGQRAARYAAFAFGRDDLPVFGAASVQLTRPVVFVSIEHHVSQDIIVIFSDRHRIKSKTVSAEKSQLTGIVLEQMSMPIEEIAPTCTYTRRVNYAGSDSRISVELPPHFWLCRIRCAESQTAAPGNSASKRISHYSNGRRWMLWRSTRHRTHLANDVQFLDARADLRVRVHEPFLGVDDLVDAVDVRHRDLVLLQQHILLVRGVLVFVDRYERQLEIGYEQYAEQTVLTILPFVRLGRVEEDILDRHHIQFACEKCRRNQLSGTWKATTTLAARLACSIE